MEESTRQYNMDNEAVTGVAPKSSCNTPPKKKHSMVLNFENKSSSIFGADQTPTPTRFIRNCEEVGLFQDLQNVNPFEETFRKAVESGKTGITALQNCRLSTQFMTDDTLHTPHVFPHIIENDSVSKPDSSFKNKTGSDYGQSEKRATSAGTVVRQEADTSQLRPIAPAAITVKPVESAQPVQLIFEMPDGRLVQLNATPLEAIATDDPTVRIDKAKLDILRSTLRKKQDSDISPLIKEKLKARLGVPGINSNLNKQGKSVDQKPTEKEEAARNKRRSSTSNASNSDDDEGTKRRKFLERNRAAAMRCREKRKCWVATLEQRADQLMTHNLQLTGELGALRAEVAQLKTLLLAHKDCSVTRAMCNNNNPIMSPGPPPLIVKPGLQIIKPMSGDETTFRQNLKMKSQSASVNKPVLKNSLQENLKAEAPKIKRLSLDIETAKQSQKNSPLVGTDEYLSSTFIPNETLELESFKPVATQVIQVNPNVLNRRLSSPIEDPLLTISPNTDSMDYS